MKRIAFILFIALVITVGAKAQTVITEKGTKLTIDSSKWTLSGSNIYSKNSGKVGIGTTAPNQKFEVKGTNAQPTGMNSVITNATFRISGNGNYALDMGTFTNSPFGSYIESQNLTATGTLPLVLNPSGGSIGIGTTSPSTKLDVNGDARIRTINTVAANTAIYPLYADANGNVVKAVANADISKYTTATVSNGGTATLSLATGNIYRGTISTSNACGGIAIAEVYISTVTTNSYSRISGITGFYNNSSTSNASATFTQASNMKINVTFPNYPGCGDNNGDFDFDAEINTSGVLTITAQNGTGSRTYIMSFKPML